MDPKLSNLDPKLQDAYNRVMGGTANVNNPPTPGQPPAPPAQDPTAAQPIPQVPSPQPPAAPEPTPPPASTETQAPPPAPAETVKTPAPPAPNPLPAGSIPGVNATMAFNAEDSHKNVGTTPVKKRGLHLMPLMIGFGILALIVVYTFVWIILFNVQVPFLPQL